MIIGLTGGIACGKSTVAKMMIELGLPIVDADVIAREVVEPGKEALQLIVDNFGQDILLEDGNLDRVKLGSIVFDNSTKRVELNKIIHPAILREMTRQRDDYLNNGCKDIVLDIPLLFENDLKWYVNKILVVAVDEDVQLRRLMERNNLSEEDALDRINSQLPLTYKIANAHSVIYNNGDLSETKDQLMKILEMWDE